MDEAETLCDRIGIVKGGRLLALDSVDNLRAKNGFEFKVTYFPKGNHETAITIYGSNDQTLIAQVNAEGIQQFTVSRTTLEDMYLALTGELEGFDDRSS